MIKSISYWSMAGGLENTLPVSDALAQVKAAGFEGLELGIAPEGELTTSSSQADCETMRKAIDASGLHVSTMATGMGWGKSLTSDDPGTRHTAIEQHSAALQRAAWCGCEALLVIPGVVTSPISPNEIVRYDHAVDRCREACRRLLQTAERVGVDLCLENVWNGLFYSPLEFASFIDEFDSDRLGVYFDVGNLIGIHQHPPHWIELLGPRIKRVHIKDFELDFDWTGGFCFCELLEGDVDFSQTVAALKSIGYDKTVVAEMLPPKEGLLDRTSAAMDRILSM